MNHETGCGRQFALSATFLILSASRTQTLRCRPGDAARLSLDGEPVEIAQAGDDIFRAAAAFERDLFVMKPLEAK